jgi:hypothetical protein
MKVVVFRRYAIGAADRRRYTIDHLVPLELGGANTLENLWPEDRDEAKRKDRVEALLRKRVCSGGMGLSAAQKAIRSNWQNVR